MFAAHAERYSRIKNDAFLHPELIREAGSFGLPDEVVWYERPIVKKIRHLRAGQWGHALSTSDLPRRYLRTVGLPRRTPVSYVGHHEAHAWAGIATSGFDSAAVIVADAIGEFDCFTIFGYSPESGLRLRYRRRYPHSLGLLYSAFTRRCGFKPNEDEYILMGMAAYGQPRHVDDILDTWMSLDTPGYRLTTNVHRGIGDWLPDARPEDLAASMQAVTERVLVEAASWARKEIGAPHLILMGGVALNCVANSVIAREAGFPHLWIFPNPGDAGSSVGAAAARLRRALRWDGPYLGTPIQRDLDIPAVVTSLSTDGVAAVANGAAEFGPRALGNRSLLADPRPVDMKDRVNRVKGREKFRPFAPVIREELLHEYFDVPVPTTPYMQFTARCRAPEAFPAVVHVDGSSRVQSVSRLEHPVLHELLRQWETESGCPVLLNTSLNSRGEPLVNTWREAESFGHREGVRVH
ncbi:carbamoyltransferase C-terminal domain-containing protein [Streptomyces lancefieldiae]|uniref:Carbamoyltransferase C-terminal domain-containing protein n=1 Tax=Streptomyces lancefieldiae TaxID=3075520 RepID=A0ABU3AHT8_9ACTN|nr:carbamoyltransferase C-terminal domain-containing protein [Streptomyces sp. DSM 40712]MDT0609092.1 carbamoyltransferase C-terminal domain-containing protein [Streptomyces sp. DSM 40712]